MKYIEGMVLKVVQTTFLFRAHEYLIHSHEFKNIFTYTALGFRTLNMIEVGNNHVGMSCLTLLLVLG